VLVHDSDDGFALAAAGAHRRGMRGVFGSGPSVFAGISLAAFASIWSMRAISRASADQSEPSEAGRLVESYLSERARPAANPSTRTVALTPLVADAPAELQVPREMLARNPFILPWKTARATAATVDVVSAADPAPVAAADAAVRIAAWEREVDEGARDFVVESMLVASDPAMSIVSMNGGVFRVGESVVFPGHAIRYEIRSVTARSIELRAFNQELDHERIVDLIVRDPSAK
jgi:hypothetical protein